MDPGEAAHYKRAAPHPANATGGSKIILVTLSDYTHLIRSVAET